MNPHPHEDDQSETDAFADDQNYANATVPNVTNASSTTASSTITQPTDQEPTRPLPFTFQPTGISPSTSSSFANYPGQPSGYSPSMPPLSSLPHHLSFAAATPSASFRSSHHQGYSGGGHGQYGSALGHHPLPSQQQLYRHHHHHHHHHEQDLAGVDVMKIDYEGLDAYVEEALTSENGFQPQEQEVGVIGIVDGSMNPPELYQDLKDHGASSSISERGSGLERTHSTGSTSIFGGSAFRRRSARKASFYSERAPRPPLVEQLRYTFYTRTTGLIQAPSLPSIVTQAAMKGVALSEGPLMFSDLLKDGCFWIDILDPSDIDMQMLSKYFHVHPLTIEDISTEEVREKYEVFKNYYFVCFRTFDQDYNSGNYLQPASMYSVVLRDGIITFHFRPTDHHMKVLRRLEQFHSHITLTPDWINYALLDDITDSFASPIQTIEYEVDSIDELVLLLRENETSDMLRRIGSCRKNVMAISRLLMNKADVIRGLMKRFDERFMVASASAAAAGGPGFNNRDHHYPLHPSNVPGTATPIPAVAQVQQAVPPEAFPAAADPTSSPLQTSGSTQSRESASATAGITAQAQAQAQMAPPPPPASAAPSIFQYQQPQPYREGEILLYLGDILDHVLTMLQSLNSYEKILSRSHSNYLAQISLEINQLSNKTNEVVGTLTFFASLIVPMTFVAGLWGMNVHVPGQPGNQGEPLNWFYGLCGFMALYCVVAIIFGKRYGLI
ncbi:CorA metal ion transporter [Gryganskiella cystojenkinii]|nr:CorA metal ion transporter [Gryganskiella cystojenkinii]